MISGDKLRVLWISAFVFKDEDESGSGVWQKTLFKELATIKQLELANIGPSTNSEYEESIFIECKQWALPRKKVTKGLPESDVVKMYEEIIEGYRPDVVHVWGSENFLKFLPFSNKFSYKKLLVMQGVLSSMSKYIFAGMSSKEAILSLGFREIVKGHSLFWEERSFKEHSMIEERMLLNCDYSIVQSEWTSNQVKWINPMLSQSKVNRKLRPEFLNCDQWSGENRADPIILASCVGYSFKGLHVLIKAVAILKKFFPAVKLHLAAAKPRMGLLGSGYFNFIHRLIRTHQLEDNIVWKGRLSAKELVKELQESSVFVQPSFVESYSVALAEAMSVGTPCAVSYAGAMPELAKKDEEALFFQPGDYVGCAGAMFSLLSDHSEAERIGNAAYLRAKKREKELDLKEIHLDVYSFLGSQT